MCRWRVVTVNAGRKAAGPEGIESLMCALATAGMAWDAVYVTELDGIRSEQVSSGRTRAGHVWHRHYPGAGSCAMAWVIHRRCTATCTGVRWRGRAGALRLRPPRVHDGSCTHKVTLSATFVGVHGGLTPEALSASIADATILYRKRIRPGSGILVGDINVVQLPATSADPFGRNKARSEHHREERERSCEACASPLN